MEPKPNVEVRKISKKSSKKKGTNDSSRLKTNKSEEDLDLHPAEPKVGQLPANEISNGMEIGIVSSGKTENDELEKLRKREAKKQKAKEKQELANQKNLLDQQAKEVILLKEEQHSKDAEIVDEDAYDQDDFEDYEDDDFEDEEVDNHEAPLPAIEKLPKTAISKSENSEVQSLKMAMEAENKAAKKQSKSKREEVTRSSAPKAEAKPRVKSTKSKAKDSSSIKTLRRALDPRSKRVDEIRQLKQFSNEKFDIFSKASCSLYDAYLRNVRSGTVRQVHSQTNEDARTIESQTDDIESQNNGMQFPDDIGLGNATTRNFGDSSSINLAKFLNRTAHACEILIEEKNQEVDMLRAQNSGQTSGSSKANEDEPFSTKGIQLGKSKNGKVSNKTECINSILEYRNIVDIQFSPDVSHILLVAYSARQSDCSTGILDNQSILAIWDVNQPEYPIGLLRSEGNASCCCIGPGRSPNYVLSGTEEGCIQLWDMRNPFNDFSEDICKLIGESVQVERPTVSTFEEGHALSSHQSRIIEIQFITKNRGSKASMLLSLDDRGILNSWSIVSASRSSDSLQSDADRQVSLTKGATINTRLSSLSAQKVSDSPENEDGSDIGPSMTAVRVFPDDSSQYLLGTTEGKVIRGSRFGKATYPKYFIEPQLFDNDLCSFVGQVSCISFSPFFNDHFLTGYSNGTLSLFSSNSSKSIASWQPDDDIVDISSIMWSKIRPAVFFVATAAGNLYVYDLLQSPKQLVFETKLTASKGIDSAQLSHSSSNIRTRRPSIAVSFGDSVMLYDLSPEFFKLADTEEIRKMKGYLDGVC